MNARRVTVLVALVAVSVARPACGESRWDAGAAVAVCTEAHDQGSPSVGSAQELGTVVLWTDTRPDGKSEGTQYVQSVRGAFIKDGGEFVVFCPRDARAQSSAISGRRVAVNHNRGWTNVLLCELPATGTLKTIADIATEPAIDRNLIVFASYKHRWEGHSGEGAPKTSWISDILAYEAGGPGVTFDVTCSDQANQRAPDVSGSIVVWQEGRANWGWANTAIFKRDIDKDVEPVRLCWNQGKQACNPAISGSVVVWEDNRNGNWDIFGYDLDGSAEIEICVAPGDQQAPAIDRGKVVWQDNRSGNWDIYARELDAEGVFAVCRGKGDQTEPDIHGEAVVWTDTRNGNKDIYMSLRRPQ